MSTLPDSAAREQALDPAESFIVQAPAGSGKTELLSLRYLKLLSICEEPEEILAITFTRKAASEMKDRIVKALSSAAGNQTDEQGNRQKSPFDNPFQQQRFAIAAAALNQSRARDWGILENPGRLKIQTIDSFCLNLATRIPLLSRLGGTPNVGDDADLSFRDAITNTLQALNSEDQLGDDIAVLLAHLDNDIGRVEKLLFELLTNRDQWLSYVLEIHEGNRLNRHYLQEALDELIRESLANVRNLLGDYAGELIELLNHACQHLPPRHPGSLPVPDTFTDLPGNSPDELRRWLLIVAILLTQKSEWRRKIDKRDGFPTAVAGDKEQSSINKAKKQQWSSLLESLSGNDALREQLAYIRLLPDPELEDEQWLFLTTLSKILTRLSSELLLSFRRFRQIDHAQVAAAALSALGSEEQPTELALALDYRLQHILVDEFQDTSRLQTELLQKLTAGWQPDDGRTLFLVGDAMQSVYGFRNANVGIYLSVREDGLGQIPLQPLTLQSNFRSQARLVNWVNGIFGSAFPAEANPSTGAVPFTASVASNPPDGQHGVTGCWLHHEPEQHEQAREQEARQVVDRVLALKEQDPDGSLAILVRSRSHLHTLIPALRSAGVGWQATDIDRLQSLPAIEDLQSLTRALVNRADRIAWLALLRAPWCGLGLADLQAVASDPDTRCIWTAVQHSLVGDGLTLDGRERLQEFTRVLGFGLRLHRHVGLRQAVEAVWTLLGGAALAHSDAEQRSVARYFDLLEHQETGQTLRDFDEFSERIADAFVPPGQSAETAHAVHILTMHKAKGLEFDHVILPCLAARPRSNEKTLLQWHERINRQGDARLFLAALSATGSDDDPLYRLLRFELSRKAAYEDTRLLYIAATRARKSLFLTATLGRDKQGDATPVRGSLLSYLWPQLQSGTDKTTQCRNLEDLLPTADTANPATSVSPANSLVTPIRRFSSPIILTSHEAGLIEPASTDSAPEDGTTEAVTEQQYGDAANGTDAMNEPAATIGTLIHQGLEILVTNPAIFADRQALENINEYRALTLRQVISDDERLHQALQFIQASISTCRNETTLRWVFDHDQTDSATELPLSRWHAGRLVQLVVDRTFVDAQDTRWIIDYKTAPVSPAMSEDEFIDWQCQHYRPQLESYRQAFSEVESRPVRMALLFTAIARLETVR